MLTGFAFSVVRSKLSVGWNPDASCPSLLASLREKAVLVFAVSTFGAECTNFRGAGAFAVTSASSISNRGRTLPRENMARAAIEAAARPVSRGCDLMLCQHSSFMLPFGLSVVSFSKLSRGFVFSTFICSSNSFSFIDIRNTVAYLAQQGRNVLFATLVGDSVFGLCRKSQSARLAFRDAWL